MFERIDLHTHSSWSDGTLTPTQLVELAAARRVELLALTDHDTVGGCGEARAACEDHQIRFMCGVELTCLWGERELHIIGLQIDPQQSDLAAHCESVSRLRRERIERMAARLSAAGLPGPTLAAAALDAASPTRMHLARALCARGFAGSAQEAFERYLQRGQPGYSAAQWPEMDTVVQRIVQSGGVAVLAHPHRYGLSATDLRKLAARFKADGGAGLEVSLAGMSPTNAARAAALARRFELAGSVGSDFHQPGLPWRPLGRFAKLPDAIVPITSCLGI